MPRTAVGPASSRHRKRVNGLTAFQGQHCYRQRCVFPNAASVTHQHRQPFLQLLDPFLINEQGENRPRQTGHRLKFRRLPPKPIEALSNDGSSRLVLQGKERKRGRLRVGRQRLPEDDTIPCVPPSSDTSAIEEHFRTGADAPLREPRRRSEEHTSELQSPTNLVCRLMLEK